MGVPGLWKLVEPAAQQRSLLEFSLKEGFEINRRHRRSLLLGVDASIWFMQCQQTFLRHHAQFGQNPELRTLFFRLCSLLHFCIEGVFVFDGPGRAKMKRGKQVRPVPHWLTTGMQEMLTAFGFPWYTAPGDAEAELACLNRKGLIDAVISEDSDTLVFNAPAVIRFPKGSHKMEFITVYTSQAIHAHSGLAYEDLLLVALLLGGDLDQAGLKGCGEKTAHQLVKAGLGKHLIDAISLPSEQRVAFFNNWRNELRRILLTDPSGIMGKRHPELSARVSDDFPNFDILFSYVKPLTSWSEGCTPNVPILTQCSPDISQIASLCHRWFSWGSSYNIILKLSKVLWPGVCFQMLYKHAGGLDTSNVSGVRDSSFTPASIQKITTTCVLAKLMNAYRVECTITPLNLLTMNALHENIPHPINSIRVGIPVVIAEHAIPEKVEEYSNHSKVRVKLKTSAYVGQILLPPSIINEGISTPREKPENIIIDLTEMDSASMNEADSSALPPDITNGSSAPREKPEDSVIDLTETDSEPREWSADNIAIIDLTEY